MDFRSPKNGSESLKADTEYTDYKWQLTLTEDGEWEIVSWGEQ